jgi:hypothetical protein
MERLRQSFFIRISHPDQPDTLADCEKLFSFSQWLPRAIELSRYNPRATISCQSINKVRWVIKNGEITHDLRTFPYKGTAAEAGVCW